MRSSRPPCLLIIRFIIRPKERGDACRSPADPSVGVETGECAEFVCDESIAAAARHFLLTAPHLLKIEPVREETWHDQADHGRSHGSAQAFGRVALAARRQINVEMARENGAGGRFVRARPQFHPPLVMAMIVLTGE